MGKVTEWLKVGSSVKADCSFVERKFWQSAGSNPVLSQPIFNCILETAICTDLGVWITTDAKVDVSLGIELSTAPLTVMVKKEANMKRTSNNIMKNVRCGIVALLGCLVVDSILSESQASA